MNELEKLLLKYPDKPWNWTSVSQNPNVTMKIVLANLDKLWDWYKLSCNQSITMKDIVSHPEIPWDWSGVSQKPRALAESTGGLR